MLRDVLLFLSPSTTAHDVLCTFADAIVQLEAERRPLREMPNHFRNICRAYSLQTFLIGHLLAAFAYGWLSCARHAIRMALHPFYDSVVDIVSCRGLDARHPVSVCLPILDGRASFVIARVLAMAAAKVTHNCATI